MDTPTLLPGLLASRSAEAVAELLAQAWNGVVGTTVRRAESPRHLPADGAAGGAGRWCWWCEMWTGFISYLHKGEIYD
jgi:hypothetical protein